MVEAVPQSTKPKRRRSKVALAVLGVLLGVPLVAFLVLDMVYRHHVRDARLRFEAGLAEARAEVGDVPNLEQWFADRAPANDGGKELHDIVDRWQDSPAVDDLRVGPITDSYELTPRHRDRSRDISAVKATEPLVAELRGLLRFDSLANAPALYWDSFRATHGLHATMLVHDTLFGRAVVHKSNGEFERVEQEYLLMLQLGVRMRPGNTLGDQWASANLCENAVLGLACLSELHPLGEGTIREIARWRSPSSEELRCAIRGSLAELVHLVTVAEAPAGAPSFWQQGFIGWARKKKLEEVTDVDRMSASFGEDADELAWQGDMMRDLATWTREPAPSWLNVPAGLLDVYDSTLRYERCYESYTLQALAARTLRELERTGTPLAKCTLPAGDFPDISLRVEGAELLVTLAPSWFAHPLSQRAAITEVDVPPLRLTPLPR